MSYVIRGFRSHATRPYTIQTDKYGRVHRHYLTGNLKQIKHYRQCIRELKPLQTALINQMDFRKMSFGTDNKSGINVPEYINQHSYIQNRLHIKVDQSHVLHKKHKLSRGTFLDLIDNTINQMKDKMKRS